MASYAYEVAIEHFERALAVKEGKLPSSEHLDAQSAALLYGLGHAQLAILQVQEGWANLTQAFNYYAEAGDIERVVDIASSPVTIAAQGPIAPLLARALEWFQPTPTRRVAFFPGTVGS